MNNLLLIAKMELKASLKSRWFWANIVLFGGLMGLFFISGVSQSRVAGFSGLTRTLLLFIQICVAIVPIIVLISTVRAASADRELGGLEYLLSFAVSLKEYYFGKVLGRFISSALPILAAMAFAAMFAIFNSVAVPWGLFVYYFALLFILCFVFVGIGFLIGVTIKSTEMGLGAAFLVWIICLAFMDLALMGLMMQSGFSQNTIFAIALLNPMQVFRVAAIGLFDYNLAVIGPAAYYILEDFGRIYFALYAFFYPFIFGAVCLAAGYLLFKKRDLV